MRHESRSSTHCSTRRTPRHGRLLVECAIGALLLTTGAVAFAGATRSVAMLASDATVVARAQARAAAVAESALVAPCGTPGASWADAGLLVSTALSGAPGGELLTTRAEPRLSPLAGRTVAPLELLSVRGCR